MHRYRDLLKWRWFRQYCSVICGRLFLQELSRESQNCGGGTGILFRDSVNVSLVDGKENKSFEFSECIVKVHDYSTCDIVSNSGFFVTSCSCLCFLWWILSVFRECCYVPRGSCYLWRLQLSFRWPPWQWHQEIYGLIGNVSSFTTRFGPDPFIGSYLGLNYYSFVRWYCSFFS